MPSNNLLATKMDQSLLPSTVNLQEFPDNKLDLYLGNFLSNLKHSSTGGELETTTITYQKCISNMSSFGQNCYCDKF